MSLKSYAFDLDQNILHTPTEIYLQVKQPDGSWKEETIPNSLYEEYTKDPTTYKRIDDDIEKSLVNFRKKGELIKDIYKALDEKRYGPARNDFKKATIDASPIGIITARWNPIEDIKEMHKIVIHEVLEDRELEELVDNMRNHLWDQKKRKDKVISTYIWNNLYIWCATKTIIDEHKREKKGWREKKALAFELFVKKVIDTYSTYYGKKNLEHRKISVGFSDDSKGNVQSVKEYIIKELIKKYPNIKFAIYDTNHPTIIRKETINNKSN